MENTEYREAIALLDEMIVEIQSGCLYYEGMEWFLSRLEIIKTLCLGRKVKEGEYEKD